MITVFFTASPVTDYKSASKTDAVAFGRWFHHLLARGIYWPASAFEAAFLSYAHTEADIERMVEAAGEAFAELVKISF